MCDPIPLQETVIRTMKGFRKVTVEGLRGWWMVRWSGGVVECRCEGRAPVLLLGEVIPLVRVKGRNLTKRREFKSFYPASIFLSGALIEG
jgi:hypothetical protein